MVPPFHFPLMPRISQTEAFRPYPTVRHRACHDTFREIRGDSAQTGDIFSGIRSTHGGGGFATQGDVYFSLSGGQEKDWMVHLKEFMPAFEKKFNGWRNNAQIAGRWFRRVEEGA